MNDSAGPLDGIAAHCGVCGVPTVIGTRHGCLRWNPPMGTTDQIAGPRQDGREFNPLTARIDYLQRLSESRRKLAEDMDAEQKGLTAALAAQTARADRLEAALREIRDAEAGSDCCSRVHHPQSAAWAIADAALSGDPAPEGEG